MLKIYEKQEVVERERHYANCLTSPGTEFALQCGTYLKEGLCVLWALGLSKESGFYYRCDIYYKQRAMMGNSEPRTVTHVNWHT